MTAVAFSDDHDDKCIRLHLKLPPSVNALYANVPGKGRVKTKAYKEWIEAAGWELKLQRPGKIAGPYDLDILVPEDMRGDSDNRIKAVSDLLVSHKIIPDDRHARSVCITRTPQVDSGAHIIVHEVR